MSDLVGFVRVVAERPDLTVGKGVSMRLTAGPRKSRINN